MGYKCERTQSRLQWRELTSVSKRLGSRARLHAHHDLPSDECARGTRRGMGTRFEHSGFAKASVQGLGPDVASIRVWSCVSCL